MIERVVVLAVVFSVIFFAGSVIATPINGEQIVNQCQLKDYGSDQRTRLTMILRDAAGKVKKSVYRRYWKSYSGPQDLNEKMMLFTEYPPDARGAAFMRWGYRSESDKKAQHWIFLPKLQKIRRLSVRDLADRFLGSELTYADITPRSIKQDRHKYIDRRRVGKSDYLRVASVPRNKSYLYSKRVHWFKLGKSWHDCVIARTDYYDHKGQLLKKQYYNWQKVKGVWLWRRVMVENVQSFRSTLFIVEKVAVNIGIRDEYFAERTLKTNQISGLKDYHRFALQ